MQLTFVGSVWEDGIMAGFCFSFGKVVGHAALAYGKKVGKINNKKKGKITTTRESWGKPGTCDR